MQSLATTSNNGIQPYQEQPEEFDAGLAPGEAKPARLLWNGRDGQLLDSLTGEVLESLTVVWLTKLPDTRIMFNPNSKAPREERVLCRSYDMRLPQDAEQARRVGAGPNCAECPFHDFSKDQYGNTLRPACSPVLNLAIATDENEPAAMLFSVKSISAATMRRAIGTIENLRTAKKRPPFAYKITLSVGPKVTEDSKAYFPLLAKVIGERVEPELWPDYANLWRMVRAYDPTAFAADAEDVAPEESAAPPASDHGTPVHVMTPDELLDKLDSGELRQATDAAGDPVVVQQPPVPASPAPARAKADDLYGETPDTTRKRAASAAAMPEWQAVASVSQQPDLGLAVPARHTDPVDSVRNSGRRS